ASVGRSASPSPITRNGAPAPAAVRIAAVIAATAGGGARSNPAGRTGRYRPPTSARSSARQATASQGSQAAGPSPRSPALAPPRAAAQQQAAAVSAAPP